MITQMYYAVYDITDNGIRESLVQVLKDAGFTRIQKSVFCGKISNQQKKDILENVKNIINQDADSFYLIMSCSQCFGKIVTIGKKFDKEYVTDSKSSMVF